MKILRLIFFPIAWSWKFIARNKGKFILLLIAGAGAYWWFFMRSSGTATTTRQIINQVKVGTLEKSIKVVGTAELIDEQQLRFNQLGEVTTVNVKVGDKVTKGQILAELDQTDAMNNIKQAEISLENAKIKLQKLLEGSEETQILQSKNNLESTKKKIDIAKQEYENTLKENSNSIENATKTLAVTKQEYDKLLVESENSLTQQLSDIDIKKQQIGQQEKSLEILKNDLVLLKQEETKSVSDKNVNVSKTVDDAITDTRKYLNDAKKHLETIDQIFGISNLNRDKNDEYEAYLSAKDTSLKTQVESYYFKVYKSMEDAESQYAKVISMTTPTRNELNNLLELNKSMFNSMIDLMNVAKDSVAASLANSSYPQTKIDSHESSIVNARTQSQSSFDSIKNTIQTIATMSDLDLVTKTSNTTITKKEKEITDAEISLKSSYNQLTGLQNTYETQKKDYQIKIDTKKNDIQKAENALALLQTNTQTTQSSKQNELSNLQDNVNLYEQTYQDVLEGSDESDIRQAQNDVEKQELALESAKTSLDKYVLEAPFDGIIRNIDFKVGDKITSDEEKYINIENPNLLEMTALVDQIDIVNISGGQSVRIVFDAYEDTSLTGMVSNIDTTAQTSAGVVSYKVTVTLDKQNLNILNGMTSKMYIQIKRVDNALIVPTSYISSMGDKKFVTVMENGQTVRKRVITGMTDGTNTQIIQGVKQGDKIVQSVVSASGASSSTTGLFTPGGNRTRTGSSSNRTQGGAGGGGMPPG